MSSRRTAHGPFTQARQYARRRMAATAAIVVIVAATITAALSISPDRCMRRQLEELELVAGLDLSYGKSRFLPWGIRLSDVALAVAGHASSTVPGWTLHVDRMLLRPSLWGLLAGRRGLPWTIAANLQQGSAGLTVDGDLTDWRTTFQWSSIEMQHVPQRWTEVQLSGKTSGRIRVSGRSVAGGRTVAGSWQSSGRGIIVKGLRSGHLLFPTIAVSRLRSEGAWMERRGTLTVLAARGSFGRIRLSGKFLLRSPLEKSGLNLELRHRPPRRVPADLAPLLRFFLPAAHATGTRTYHVGGTIAMPAVTPVSRNQGSGSLVNPRVRATGATRPTEQFHRTNP